MKKPWPTKDAMQQVYENNLWGGDRLEFYSGEGSHKSEIVHPYIQCVISFLNSFDPKLTVCDLGCGDFNIGRQLVEHTHKYVAIDIVPNLIERNKNSYQAAHLEFHCMDISVADLPKGDCVILRQVLQHLSNNEIQRILPKLTPFKYLILTEHIPQGDFTPNLDIISGQGIRLKKQSGVDVLAPPFNLMVKEVVQLLSQPLEKGKGVIVTSLYHML